MSLVGIRFSLGYAIMVISVYIAHVLLGISFSVSVIGLFVASMLGFRALYRRQNDWAECKKLLVHPALLLIILGLMAVAVNGGIGYLPYTHDEFSHWLATPRLIHMSGSWADVVDSLHLPFYTPGWQLTLLLPWQILGKEDFGMSAAAPFVLHVTVIALIYDLVVFQLRCSLNLAQHKITLIAWAFTFLFLAAEGMGRLWPTTLLIEQPQIYSYATVLLLILVAEITGQDRKALYGIAGTVLASAYLYKVAALIFVPAIIGLYCVVLLGRTNTVFDRFKSNIISGALIVGPILLVMISWSMTVKSNTCSPLSLSADQIAHIYTLDWKGLAVRYGSAIGTYIIGYKLILTIAASLGVIGALTTGKYRATLIFILLSTVYFVLLYVYHLTCFGPYYFETLNSIPRFTRVPLQVFHALGLVMLIGSTLHYANKSNISTLRSYSRQYWINTALIITVIALAGLQGRQILRRVDDVTSRTYQSVDPRISEMRDAAKRIEGLRGISLPKRPLLTIISQEQDNAVINYAEFYAMGYKAGNYDPHFTVSKTFSWSPKPNEKDVVQDLSKPDIIWPINLDPWLKHILSRLVSDRSCLNSLPNKALIRDTTDQTSVRFRCIEKAGP
jgi:hypothetical protein